MSTDAERLQDMLTKIEEAKKNKSETEGQQKALLKQLKDTFGCKSLEEARKLRDEMSGEIEELEVSVAAGVNKLEKDYDWD